MYTVVVCQFDSIFEIEEAAENISWEQVEKEIKNFLQDGYKPEQIKVFKELDFQVEASYSVTVVKE